MEYVFLFFISMLILAVILLGILNVMVDDCSPPLIDLKKIEWVKAPYFSL